MNTKRVAIVAGGRTPFIKSNRSFAEIDSLAMAVHATRGTLDRSGIDPAVIESVAFGTMTPDPLKPNLARELVFEAGLPIGAEAYTVASYCITGLRAVTVIADAIAGGRIEAGLADELTAPIDDEATALAIAVGQRGRFAREEWDAYRQRTGGLLLRRGFAGGLSERALRAAWAPPAPVGRG